MSVARYDEVIVLPRAVRFPVELTPPEGFDSERLETWPPVAGRLEYVEGRLLFMPLRVATISKTPPPTS